MAVAWDVLGLGFALGLSLAAPPGPILALSAQRTVQHGYWPGLAVPMGAIFGDGTLALLMGLGVVPLLARFEAALDAAAIVGAALLAFFAYRALRAARAAPDPAAPAAGSTGARRAGLMGGFATGYALAVTSPFNFGWWLSAGTSLFHDHGPTVFVGFFAALVAFTVAFVAGVRWAARSVRSAVTIITYASAVLLAAFALLLLWEGATGLAGRL